MNMIEWQGIYAKRRDKLRKLIKKHGLDALLVARPANRFYLSGFELHDPQPDESSGYLVICADGADWLATDPRYELAAARLWDPRYIYIYHRQRGTSLAKLLASCGMVIGVETDGISASFLRKLEKGQAGRFKPAFTSANRLVESLRIQKDPEEIKAMKESFNLNHEMMRSIQELVASGRIGEFTEKSLAWHIEKFFREHGAQELAFETIVAKGANAALPHAVPGEENIGENSNLLIDAGCRVNNYCSDQTRSWWVGKEESPDFKKILQLVKDAQQAAFAVMREGVSCELPYRKAMEVFEKAHVEKAFTHSLGHGIGLQTHEPPSLAPGNKTILKAGMTVTVEPGLYYGTWGGARWEHTVLIKEDGIDIF